MSQTPLEMILGLLTKIQPFGKWEKNTPLFESGGIDSITIFEKILPSLEEIYGIHIEPLELVPENFETPEAIAAYVEGKRTCMK
mgnify:CR=1 FL=1